MAEPMPVNLAHKPVFAVEGYDAIDGPYAGNTDAQHLSIGLAQWNTAEISLKVWRHTGEKWSRQSEELPPHRVVDLALLYCLTRLARADGSEAISAGHGNFQLDVTMKHGDRTSNTVNSMLRVVDSQMEELDTHMRDRLLALSSVLDDMKHRGLL
ncbi:MAG: DUF6530 family protein [Bacillota bacterium]